MKVIKAVQTARVAALSLGLLVVGGRAVGAATPTDAADFECDGRQATIVGTNDRDKIDGTAGPDVIVSLGSRDVIRGRGGDDVICAGNGADSLQGGHGNDRLFGERNHIGRDGDVRRDRFHSSKGDDYMDGGAGINEDRVTYSRVASGIDYNQASATVTGKDSGTDTLVNIDGIIGTQFADVMTDTGENFSWWLGLGGDDVMSAGGHYNSIDGGSGNDTLTSAGTVDDQFFGGDGDDLIDGGAGHAFSKWGDGGAGIDTCRNLTRSVNCEL